MTEEETERRARELFAISWVKAVAEFPGEFEDMPPAAQEKFREAARAGKTPDDIRREVARTKRRRPLRPPRSIYRP